MAAETKPATDKPAAASQPAAAPKIKKTTRTEASISGLTSETSDQFSTGIKLNHTAGPKKWFFNAGYRLSKTRTYSGDKTNETKIGTYSLDSQYRTDSNGSYKFISGTASIRDRSPYTVTYGDRTGYWMLSGGYGRTLWKGLEGEVSLAGVTIYDHGTDHRVTPVYSLRWKRGLTDSLTADGYAYFVDAFSSDPLVDSRINLTHQLSDYVSLRLTYRANNMLRPIRTKSGWDKAIQISLVFRRTLTN